LRILQRETVSLVLLDWKMPKKTGIEVLQQMRASGRKIPVIMVTSEADKDCVVTAINNGVNDYIVKPINASTVAQKINRIMNPESVEEAETS
jgi:two-component system chemotaxis response regulator CheY